MPFWKKQGGITHIAVFLGNPGREYERTRHNVGFMCGDLFAEKLGVKINKLKFSALTATAAVGGTRIFLMKPQTYMNLSGGAVWQAMSFYNVPPERVIAIADDVTLPVGKLRIRRKGSAGGHNGLADIIKKCGGDEFPRIKIGVGSPPEQWDMADWVLSKFSPADEKEINAAISNAEKALETMIVSGVDAAMSAYN
ncbi:MAG: aminoacyl-tRNA hydrolase [Oscillospiraceae bacterium]|nr:aminoacyl-tRNA hydrolase [Oscillospiraceae bacterium]